MSIEFPDDFVWGVAASSYQIEGDSAGRGRSIWDSFARWPGKVVSGHSGESACEHVKHYEADVDLISDLGAQAYRLSISWPRLLPSGTGAVNKEGLEFYDRLIDRLLNQNIQPWVTLFHWDLPSDLQRQGGFSNPAMVDWFAQYTEIIADRYGDRVQHWMTLNELACFIGLGLSSGVHAPGLKLPDEEVFVAQHHALMAHGRSVQLLREKCTLPPQIGCAPTGVLGIPSTSRQEDIDAAYNWTFKLDFSADPNFFSYLWTTEPTVLGRYPEGFDDKYGHAMPRGYEDDLSLIKQPLDFLGMNIYNGKTIRAGEDGKPIEVPHALGHGQTAIGWPVTPSCLAWGARHAFRRYGLPIYITENGLAGTDWVSLYGGVHDTPRIDFMAQHLLPLQEAIAEGVDCRGYFHWSLMDNFEWAEGYQKRFGIVYVDFQTQQRIPKDSFWFYRDLINSNGGNLDEVHQHYGQWAISSSG
ncbi:GH1 family beta-glucosidase [Algisphaera agarilytica]|uniref:Beta-glucosidase n=1 Tax=Algisphaera agarilytica TaxID=1385975 RepID=A0A7X0H4H1_9BACT|nr:GH1 family beta-glucosidase [Algisphaera agarilytica]MBB6429116.1 beta-glucosidase [Algisphaera agarilytica]